MIIFLVFRGLETASPVKASFLFVLLLSDRSSCPMVCASPTLVSFQDCISRLPGLREAWGPWQGLCLPVALVAGPSGNGTWGVKHSFPQSRAAVGSRDFGPQWACPQHGRVRAGGPATLPSGAEVNWGAGWQRRLLIVRSAVWLVLHKWQKLTEMSEPLWTVSFLLSVRMLFAWEQETNPWVNTDQFSTTRSNSHAGWKR